MMYGTVTSFDGTHGYGFIAVDSLDYAVFVHVNAIITPAVSRLQVGQKVAFDLVTDLQVPRAANVALVHRSCCVFPPHRGRLGAVSRRQRGLGRGRRYVSPRLSKPVHGAGREQTGTGQRNTAQTGYPYTLSRILDAPVAKVWEVWTQPEHFARWLNAPLPSISLDMRPGGSWRATMVAPDGTERPMSGSYGKVIKRRRLVITLHVPGCAEPTVCDITFTNLGSQTRITFTLTSMTDEKHKQASAGGGAMMLEGFSAYLAGV